jgi:cysteine desulfurase
MVTRRIYCDYAASTPLDPAVSSAMRDFHETHGPGNASSLHHHGRALRAAMDTAHDRVANLIGCDFKNLLFTSGGTEADNLAVIGSLLSRRESGRNRIVVGASEHHAVIDAARFAGQFLGADVRIARVDSAARVDLEHLKTLVDDKTAVVSVQHANNELGSLQPVREVADIAHHCGAWFHCDAVQTPVTAPFTAAGLGADLISVSSHKIYGPAGIGALVSQVPIQPLHIGGAQERGLRAGSENVVGAVGFGAAADLEITRQRAGSNELKCVANLVQGLRAKLGDYPTITINSPTVDAISTLLHVSIVGQSTEDILMLLDRKGISASGGAACASGAVEPSHVVKACGWTSDRQAGALRLSFGLGTTLEEVDYVAKAVGLIASNG